MDSQEALFCNCNFFCWDEVMYIQDTDRKQVRHQVSISNHNVLCLGSVIHRQGKEVSAFYYRNTHRLQPSKSCLQLIYMTFILAFGSHSFHTQGLTACIYSTLIPILSYQQYFTTSRCFSVNILMS